ncbi:MAG: C69 family dipeptidase [Candidatus Marinimicrobia bacterium]|nr:C69 family dipeptidase [Candidatus Neomarinimicrobiota bacterium]
MTKIIQKPIVILILSFSLAHPCTNLLVSKEATQDSSTIITYTCDGEFHPHLQYTPAADYQEGDSLEITNWSGELLGKIPRPRHTYAVVGLMNEHQLMIGETTFSGREELREPDGLLHYWTLMRIALRRAKTARKAIRIITELVDQYGYASSGESISIADPDEAWILEIIGKGKGSKDAVWVARKVPAGFISCHANKARIGTFPKDNPDMCLYSKDVIDFAIEKGYYDPGSGKEFSFRKAYCPDTPKNKRYADGRVWSIFRRAAPSKKFSPAYFRGNENANPYPLFIKPDKNLSMQDVVNLMRDHFEGTEFSMRKGVDAGPFGTPNRWRPINWEVDGQEYAWERPISTQQTGFSFIGQARNYLPDPIGGVYWYGVDDTYTTCYIPLYCSINQLPESFTIGSLQKFSWDSAWWTFNFVANFANLKYSYMIKDIQKVQNEIESKFFELQPAIESNAINLFKDGKPKLAKKYLTDYCISNGKMVVDKWKKLGEYLIVKYNDGYEKNENGRPTEQGYPKAWLQDVIKLRPEQFKLPKKDQNAPSSKLID